jgi:hypothetical protein
MAEDASSSLGIDPVEARRRVRFRSRLGLVLLLGTVVLLLLSMVLPWWTATSTLDGGLTAHMGADGQVSVVVGNVTLTESYAAADRPTTGQLYEYAQGMLILGMIACAAAAGLAYVMPRKPDLAWAALLLGLLVFALGVIAPLMVAFQQPAAMAADLHAQYDLSNQGSGFSSPTSSFAGQASTSSWSETWGPDVGWVLSIAAAGLGLVGALFAFSARLPPGLEPERGEPGRRSSRKKATPSEVEEDAPPRFEEEADPLGYFCATCGLHFDTFLEFHSHLSEVHPSRVVDR